MRDISQGEEDDRDAPFPYLISNSFLRNSFIYISIYTLDKYKKSQLSKNIDIPHLPIQNTGSEM